MSVLTGRVCLFYFCHHLSILGIASILSAVQQGKKMGFFVLCCHLIFYFLRVLVQHSFSYSGLSSNTLVLE